MGLLVFYRRAWAALLRDPVRLIAPAGLLTGVGRIFTTDDGEHNLWRVFAGLVLARVAAHVCWIAIARGSAITRWAPAACAAAIAELLATAATLPAMLLTVVAGAAIGRDASWFAAMATTGVGAMAAGAVFTGISARLSLAPVACVTRNWGAWPALRWSWGATGRDFRILWSVQVLHPLILLVAWSLWAPLTVVALPLLALGLAMHRRLEPDTSTTDALDASARPDGGTVDTGDLKSLSS
jgi:hypothetical protein